MKRDSENNQEQFDDLVSGSAASVSADDQADAAGALDTGPVADDFIALPAGSSIEDLTVEGRDLIINLADGSRIVVPDGAVFVPQIAVDGVIVPPQTIAQLLTGNEPEPAAGPPQSSGGNFAGDEGEIQAAFNIGDLLPFTELAFPEFREEEIIPNVDDEPEVVIETIDNPVGVENAIATVDEDGLPERGEPEGTQADTDSETTSGTIVFEATDGLSSIIINGVEVTTPGQVITTPVGELTIVAIDLDTGEVDFEYTLTDNLVGEGTDPFEVTIIDADGDEATATLNIIITDDGPIAENDLGVVEAGSHDPITGDVLVNDVPGADGYAPDGAVQGFSNASGTAEPGDTLQGEFGTLTLNADGTYTYTRDLDTPGGVEEDFEYTIVDADGSTSTAILTIQIEDSPTLVTDVPRIGEGTAVNEGALAPRVDEPVGSSEGSDGDSDNNSDPSENTGATISFNSPDGLDNVTLNGIVLDAGSLPQTIISDATGILVVTGVTYDPVTGDGTIEYDYTLIDNTSGDDTSVTVDIAVTDLDGDVAEDTLVINIIDDEPAAADDSETQADENTPVTIDVLSNDTPGADDVDVDTVTVVDGTLSGDGTLVNNGDGTFTYTPGPTDGATVTFDYTITDGDGDVATATATLELLPDSEPEISAEGTDVADEAGLGARGDEPAGSDEASDSEFAQGTIAINTGGDTVGSLVINGTDVTNGGTVTTDKGVLTVTLNGGDYEYTYELTDNTLVDGDTDPFTVTVTDSDGDTASTTIVISILDDAPSAEDDAGSLAAGEYGPIGGDVLVNDTQGADGAVVTSYVGTGGSGDAGETVQGEYGVLTIAADGTYSYTRDPGTPGGVSDTFTYTITDGDGDEASADLVISIANSTTTLDLPTAGEDGTIVDEAGLDGPPAGSDAAADSETTASTFTFTAPDGPATVTIGGVAITAVGQTFTGSFGTLEITSIADGAIGYTYTLDGSTSGDTTSDSFDVRVTDVDGDFSESALEIAIIDDIPVAVADTNSVTEGASATGNVL
uniref:beta strand repeat-containing protein n=1 Tax=uncultured Erythrobacter sp. TaxID=263913 RepID=UPI00262035ED